MDQETIKKLRAGEEVPGVDPKELALIRFGRKVAKDPTQISGTDIQALREKGLEEVEIAEAVSVVMALGPHQHLCQCPENRGGCGTRSPE